MQNILKRALMGLVALLAVLMPVSAAPVAYSVKGFVLSAEDGEPVDLALVRLNTSAWSMTDKDGAFSFPKLEPGTYSYEVTYLGYEPSVGTFDVKDSNLKDIHIFLKPSNLALDEVVVTASESRLGSSSRIGQAAIMHLQAKSVEDMLQLLPGAVTKNPDLTNAGQASIREIDAGSDSNNALGTAVVVDGSPLTNDANMQVFSTAISGNNSSQQMNTMNDQTTAGRGVDLRQVSPDNIESIEVIRGIPSVEYGNLTSGAVIINTKAGATPWEIMGKVDSNSKLFSLGKGFRFRRHNASMNMSVDYTSSNADRRKTYLVYDRITANVGFSKVFFQTSSPLSFNIKATYHRNLSDTKSDESLLRGEYLRNEDQGFRLAVNGNWRLDRKLITNLAYSASLQYSHQQDIYNRNVGSGVVPSSNSYLPGEMQVSFLPGSYMCHYLIDGKPLNLFAQLKAGKTFLLDRGTSAFKLGVDYTYNANKGDGMVYDPALPPTQGEGQSVRPRSFKSIPAASTLAAFFENHTEYSLGSTVLSVMPGVRINHMFIDKAQALRGNITTADPRVNATYSFLTPDNNRLFSDLSLTGGYGIASKMPTMSMLYPTPAYFDFSSYSSYIGADDPRNIAIMTTAVIPNTANPDIKPARSHKWEIGLRGRIRGVSGNVTFFKEHTDNEFGFSPQFFRASYNRYVIPAADQGPVTIPEYRDGALYYTTADGTVKKAPFSTVNELRSYNSPSNVMTTDKHGIEYSFNFGRIKPLATDVIVDGAWFRIKRRDTESSFNSSRVEVGKDPNGVAIFNNYYAEMPEGLGSIRERVNTNFRFVTHIPSIRLIFSTTLQVVWHESEQNIWEDASGNSYITRVTDETGKEMLQVNPVGYYDNNMNYHPWDPDRVERPYDLIYSYSNTRYYDKQTYPLTCMLNFKVTKEMGRYFNVSFIANNFLKFSRNYRRDMLGGYRELYTPMYFGAEIKAKF